MIFIKSLTVEPVYQLDGFSTLKTSGDRQKWLIKTGIEFGMHADAFEVSDDAKLGK
ncbi:hypothetical protein ACLB1E_25650 [Escherichia coli]